MIILCPVCGFAEEPAASIRALSICGHCGASLVVDAGGQATRATANDTAGFDVLEMQQLVRARASLARADRPQR
jgi:hypothetical protein